MSERRRYDGSPSRFLSRPELPIETEDRPPASRADKFVRYVEKALAGGLGLTFASLTYKGLCSALRCANSGVGLPFLFLSALAGLLAIGVFLVVAENQRKDWLRRVAISGAAVLVIVALLLLPAQQSGQAALALMEKQSAERIRAERAEERAAAEWRAAVVARGDHGPPGAVPPALRVESGAGGVIVYNITQQPQVVALARVREDESAPGGWRACAMHTDGDSGGRMRFYGYNLAPGKRATFVTIESCPADFKDALIEYRVGRFPDKEAWWSDSAFAAPKGREDAEGR